MSTNSNPISIGTPDSVSLSEDRDSAIPSSSKKRARSLSYIGPTAEMTEKILRLDQAREACFKRIDSLGQELREFTASQIIENENADESGAVPLGELHDEDSLVIKVKHLQKASFNMIHCVLYVDDEKDNCLVFAETFDDEFKVLTANNGQEALAILEREHVDVLVTDQRMPQMSGVELCRLVKNRFPNVIRMIVSAYLNTESMTEAYTEAQIRCFIPKPWEHDRIVSVLQEALASQPAAKSASNIRD